MKKRELFNISCKGRTIYNQVSEEEMFDIVDELAEKFYQTGEPNPEDIEIELIKQED